MASSKDVATYFGKLHKNVLADIDDLISEAPECRLSFQPTSATVAMPRGGGRTSRAYDMNRDGFTLLAMGFTGAEALKFKLAYIAEFKMCSLRGPPIGV